MENTIENKEIFIAQHWGQSILIDVDNSGKNQYYPIERSNMYRIEESHIELTPLSQITDEDASNVLSIHYRAGAPFSFTNAKYVVVHMKYIDLRMSTASDIVDYLRSKGYALPWMGISIETLIEWRWVKLKEG